MKLSISVRIFLALFFVGLVPFYGLLYFMYLSSSDRLRHLLHIEQQKRVDAVSIMVQQDIDVLQRESAFLAAIPLMDDLISDDIDHRIDNLLDLKQAVYKLHTELRVEGLKKVVAETDGFKRFLGKGLLFEHKIFASFKPKWQIGTIAILLPFASLEHYFATREDAWCVRFKNAGVAGECSAADDRHIVVAGDAMANGLQITMYMQKQKYEQPLEVLKTQLLLIALFSLLALMVLFVFVGRIVSRPIAQNIRLQQQKLELLEAARQAAEAKSRFTSQISHEFRTPLNSIIGFSQFLDREELVDPQYKKIPKLVEQSGKDLLALINQILDFAKAEQSVMEMKPEYVLLDKLAEEVMETLKPQADVKGLSVSCDCERVSVMADRRMLKGILVNLVANAIKYTHEGYVHIEIRRENGVRVSVRDSGIGIPADQAESLFEPFQRFKGSEQIQGSGLGLALSYAYAQRMGARLFYVAHQEGSEFVVTFKEEAA